MDAVCLANPVSFDIASKKSQGLSLREKSLRRETKMSQGKTLKDQEDLLMCLLCKLTNPTLGFQ